MILLKLGLPDNDVVKYFKQIDDNFDGKISKQEIIDAFDQAGIDIKKEIEGIMGNLDNDKNGFIEYSELTLILTDWASAVKRKTLNSLFQLKNNCISLEAMRKELSDINDKEWGEFIEQVEVTDDGVKVESFKEYIKSQLD